MTYLLVFNEIAQWMLILLLFSSTGQLWKAVTHIATREDKPSGTGLAPKWRAAEERERQRGYWEKRP